MMSGSEEVFYVGTDNHVHEIWGWLSCKNGPQFDGWHPTDLNLANGNGAPATEPFSPLASFEDTLTGDDQVFYVDNIHHLHEFFFTKPAIWQQFDVTHISGSNPVRPRSTLAGHEDSFTPSEEVSFEGVFGNLGLVSAPSLIPLGWAPVPAVDRIGFCTAPPGTPQLPPAVGSPLATDMNVGNIDEIYYVANNGHIFDVFKPPFGAWQCNDITAEFHSPNAVP
jgi:hypothetical protein